MNSLTQSERDKKQLPRGGQWYWKQADMLEVYCATGGFPVSWDTETKTKIYGLYPSAREFYECLLDNPVDKRWGYEVIPERISCRAYMDIEWIGEPDADHSRLANIVSIVRENVKNTFELSPEIYVCCGTRPSNDGLTKHSYHLVIFNLVFETNHDGEMKRFFTPDGDDVWYSGDEQKSVVDLKVYTRNRVFRLPLCCKHGSSVPLTRISGDALEDEFNHSFLETDIDAMLPFVLSNPPQDGDIKFVRTPPSAPAAKKPV